ncbi:MAG: CPCC family cysteine-rich protein [Myxococcota bacterium]|jgi:hypothetical protein|nr:CPCC family cysteine-rich protein [Myxococcota bacterium]
MKGTGLKRGSAASTVDVLGEHRDEPLAVRRLRFDALLAPARNLTFDEFYHHHWYEPVRFSCPCCGFPALDGRGYADFCVVCFWRDDGRDDAQADQSSDGTDNAPWTLAEARANFLTRGCLYAPDRRNRGSLRGEVHPSTMAAKRALIAGFYRLLDADPSSPAWLDLWLEALRLSQDLIHIRGLARERGSEGRKIPARRLAESEQLWTKAPPGLPGCLRRGAAPPVGPSGSGERRGFPKHRFTQDHASCYLEGLSEDTLAGARYESFMHRLEGWLLFLAADWSEARHGHRQVCGSAEDALAYLHSELPEELATRVMLAVSAPAGWESLGQDERSEFVCRRIAECEGLHGLVVAAAGGKVGPKL